MQVHTERGLINVEAEYQSEEKAKMDGYSYAFYSKELEKKVYSKCLDDRGLYHTFALIIGYNQNNYLKGETEMNTNIGMSFLDLSQEEKEEKINKMGPSICSTYCCRENCNGCFIQELTDETFKNKQQM